MQGNYSVILCAKISDGTRMEHVSIRLRDLRKAAAPRLTVRAMAAALDLPLGTYAFYEAPAKFKKAALPLDLTRNIAAVLARHGVDSAEVMKLAGLKDAEAEPEAREIEAARPAFQFVSLPVALPSEAALADMFESLLVLVPKGATRAEAARILAQRLPSGFAAIGPAVFDQGTVPLIGGVAAPRASAKDHHGPAQS
ncbi:XRE family transcriptional regulator [Sphingobium sp. BYY-5]|uniref:XRE family transcriptional regulator n=1 Tax=Sphingobium sp. BYY-5 TaxID=2926400 RepID=UPI001FA78678|nr:XRE family transcriptional regulator [Sphingobium sp. BYY-5]MCI4588591.1 XRE family transcriptional regulator [Sphingobium sp. BYY-5]